MQISIELKDPVKAQIMHRWWDVSEGRNHRQHWLSSLLEWNCSQAGENRKFQYSPHSSMWSHFCSSKKRQLLFCALVLGKGHWGAPCSTPGNKTCCLGGAQLNQKEWQVFPLSNRHQYGLSCSVAQLAGAGLPWIHGLSTTDSLCP